MEVKVWTDGGTRGNGTENALGAWGYWGYYDFEGVQVEFSGGRPVPNTTNQRMELQAAIKALTRIYDTFFDPTVSLYTDSAYLYNCWKDKWWFKWFNNNWLNSKDKPVANKDLWIQLAPFFTMESLTLHKVKGHSGDRGNERADEIVNEQMNMYLTGKEIGVIIIDEDYSN